MFNNLRKCQFYTIIVQVFCANTENDGYDEVLKTLGGIISFLADEKLKIYT